MKTNKRRRTQIRDIFGIVPLPLYTKSYTCKISCIYCPQCYGFPKSYLKNEDTERARRANYEPDLQLNYWIAHLDKEYNTSKPIKLEIIILGGTFCDLSQSYREQFFKKMYDRLNQSVSTNLEEAIKLNKNAKYRAFIINVETRPDTINKSECRFLRKLGISKVEIGVQSLDDEILQFVGRPYTKKKIKESTAILREEGFKIGYHMMLNLPYSNYNIDRLMLNEIVVNPDFSPDFLKIYPLTLIRDKSQQRIMWQLYEQGLWNKYSNNELLTLLYELKCSIPEHIRISRIQRQFDNSDFFYGSFGFRNKLSLMLKENNNECNCIRCQEIRTFNATFSINSKKDCVLHIKKISDQSYFISVKPRNNLKSLLAYVKLHMGQSAIVRELKVLGKATPVGEPGQFQGRGIGKFLIKEVEKFVSQKNYKSLLINASPGARGFFLQFKYDECNNFLKKKLYE